MRLCRAAATATALLPLTLLPLMLLPAAPAAASSSPRLPAQTRPGTATAALRRYPHVACVPYLPANTSYVAIHRTYTTDAIGRPVHAIAPKLTEKTSPRSDCEATVGGWGGAGYQGGHLIASTLRGVSERYNLVPMQGNQINQGLMKKIENGAKRCLRAAAVDNYTVTLTYPAGNSVVPERIAVSMLPRALNPAVPFHVHFPNSPLTPRAYTRKKNQIAEKFADSGC